MFTLVAARCSLLEPHSIAFFFSPEYHFLREDMGNFLEQPVTDKHTAFGEVHGLKYAVSSMQGWRVGMEVGAFHARIFRANQSLLRRTAQPHRLNRCRTRTLRQGRCPSWATQASMLSSTGTAATWSPT